MGYRTFTHGIARLINILFALCLAICYLAIYISPADLWLPGLMALITPIFLAINLLFLVYWTFRWRRTALISLITICAGIPLLRNFFALHASHEDLHAEFRVMSYNVNLFHMDPWSKRPSTAQEIAKMVHEHDIDILCMQEHYLVDSILTEEEEKELFMKNVQRHTSIEKFGLATFSRFMIVNEGGIDFPDSFNGCSFVDLKILNDTIRVYNVHLQSFRFKKNNIEFIRNPTLRLKGKAISEVTDVSNRVRSALKKRALQADLLRAHIDQSPYPVIVCGDFNDSPMSYAYNTVRGDMYDAFLTKGSGLGTTYKGLFPSFRIDYILYTSPLKAVSFQVLSLPYSDHYPVIASFTNGRKMRDSVEAAPIPSSIHLRDSSRVIQ